MNDEQRLFMDHIIDHFKNVGPLDLEQLSEAPYTDIHQDGLYGLFEEGEAERIVEILLDLNEEPMGSLLGQSGEKVA